MGNDARPNPGWPHPVWLTVIALGAILSLKGYDSRSGDQAYRLPLLIDRQDPSAFATDPFVRAFDDFNPHSGYLTLLDITSRATGLSLALFAWYAATFAALTFGLRQLASAVWPQACPAVGWLVVGLVVLAKAGNLGTNHLFEPMLLDRQMALALSWLALGHTLLAPRRPWLDALVPALAVALACWIHPSLGLQIGAVVGLAQLAGWLVDSVPGRPSPLSLARPLGLLGLAMLPTALWSLRSGSALLEGLDPATFRLLAVEIQGPQHMLPASWRWDQWAAGLSYLALAALSLGTTRWASWPRPRKQLALILIGLVAVLATSVLGIEVARDLRLTLFQPFRLATVARGLALVAASGLLLDMIRSRSTWQAVRAGLLVTGLASDRAMLVAVSVECLARFLDRYTRPQPAIAVSITALALGLFWLERTDPAEGHYPLLAGALGAFALRLVANARLPQAPRLSPARLVRLTAYAWAMPVAAILWPLSQPQVPGSLQSARSWMLDRWRFTETPRDDVERLALWCRTHTPAGSRFVGPPGPKTFRLWARRPLAFNRAGGPYHARGLADWGTRFVDHVRYNGTLAEFARAYRTNRHALEREYDLMSESERVTLALVQGATHVVAAASSPAPGDRLQRLHAEGRYAVYRVVSPDSDSASVGVSSKASGTSGVARR